MKPSLRSAFLVLARLRKSLQPLQESLRGGAPQPVSVPVPVPIPIRAERRTRGPIGWHPCRGS